MKIAITGADGFLGRRLAAELAAGSGELRASALVLTDVCAPPPPPPPERGQPPAVECRALDLTAPGAADQLVTPDLDVLFHLAAVVSGHAEADFDLGMRVNFDATRALLEATRRRNPALRFVFASTVGVFGGELPAVVTDGTAVTPQTSYGAAKAMSELLVWEYARRGFVDGRAVRLPTVTVRGGAANRAVTSFASGVVREPLAGAEAVCPVPAEQRLWVASPRAVVANLVRCAALERGALGPPALALPGLRVSAGEMVAALRRVAGERVAARVRFAHDEHVARMVASFPEHFDASRALRLGCVADGCFEDIIREYIRDDLKGSVVY